MLGSIGLDRSSSICPKNTYFSALLSNCSFQPKLSVISTVSVPAVSGKHDPKRGY